jgi:hypothetical protein
MLVGSSPTPGACCGPAHTYECMQSLILPSRRAITADLLQTHGWPPRLPSCLVGSSCDTLPRHHHPALAFTRTFLPPQLNTNLHQNNPPSYSLQHPTCHMSVSKTHQAGYTWRGGPGVRTGEGDRVPSAAAAAAAAITAAPKLEPSACGLNTSSGMSLRARAPAQAESSV